MSEISYFQDQNVNITNARAVLSGTTYAMSNITSVSMGERAANRNPGCLVTILGFIGWGVAGALENMGVLIVCILAFLVGIALIIMAKPSYVVRISSASGEVEGLVSQNKEYIQKVINALNEAIINRG